jgi:hypothetical protein
MFRNSSLVLTLTGALTVSAFAAGTPQERSACAPDAFRFCTAVFPSESQVLACLKANLAKLSRGCHNVSASNSQVQPARK